MDNRVLAAGSYARKQIFSRSRLVAWSHGRRFELAAELVDRFAGGRLLDFGCGDGTFAAMVHDRFATVVGTDSDAAQLADCAARFRNLANVTFVPQSVIAADGKHDGAYDVVTCMEVLEHCVDDVRAEVMEQLHRLVRRDGRVIVSVPIETGLSLPAKQVARRIAGWRAIGDYRYTERYGWGELARMTCAREGTRIVRPVYTAANEPEGTPYTYHGHKGFNWRLVSGELQMLFRLEERRCSPMPVLGTILNSQVWLVCIPR